eukprot:Gregarina_sp_Poly_1__9787@NODE_624_length_7087_cov_45_976353_g478_i0_p4_GENE_NODE_624_length_7087_cov_45_976353_g478_i0NODE_624_length_7087_cov_45_976353_g478_i0_p4_ORF_typecomplete_len260_score36_43Peptidase_C26/PF07722_13/3_7e54GATase/PF00117_28/7_1e13Arm/PF00514_23/0_13_NODE_624_length_7087_cov_45_976353_g478_i061716950
MEISQSHQRRPIIAVPCRLADSVDDPDVPVPMKNDLCLVTYTRAIVDAGGLPILLPCVDWPGIYDSLLERHADGILLPGGCDVGPKYYGEEPHAKLGHIWDDVDKLDFYLAEKADYLNLPCLGICRGMQVMNVVRGGNILQDLGEDSGLHEQHDKPRDSIVHVLEIEPQSQLAKIIGDTHIGANSLHHQAIKSLGRGLMVSAICQQTKIIEAIEDVNAERFFIGIQSHPEELQRAMPGWRTLFAALVREAQNKKKLEGD